MTKSPLRKHDFQSHQAPNHKSPLSHDFKSESGPVNLIEASFPEQIAQARELFLQGADSLVHAVPVLRQLRLFHGGHVFAPFVPSFKAAD